MMLDTRSRSVGGCAHRPPGGADIVYTGSFATWQAAWRRGMFMPEDRLASSLLGNDRVGRLLVCNHARSLPVKLLRDLSRSDRAPFPADERTRLVQPWRLRRHDPVSIRGAERGFAAYDRALERAVRRLGLHDPVVITSHPLLAGFAELSWARAVTFYATDDWAAHPGFDRWRHTFGEAYTRTRRHGRRVAAVSSVILERLDPAGPSAVIPNGLDPGEWIGEAIVPDWVGSAPRPLLVYAGMLDSRIDRKWLLALARAFSTATIALVGLVADADHLAPLRALPNIRFTGMLPRGPVTGLIRAADVGLLPHVASPLTASMSPLKLFEYLAAGLPVAGTDLAPVRALEHPRVVLVAPGGEFVGGVRAALGLGAAPEHERLQFVEHNSWRLRHEQLLDLALA